MINKIVLEAISPEGIRRQIRAALTGRTQEQVGDLIGVNRQAVSRWLKEEGGISIENLRALYAIEPFGGRHSEALLCLVLTGDDGRGYVCQFAADMDGVLFHRGAVGKYRVMRDDKGNETPFIDRLDGGDPMPMNTEAVYRVIGTLQPITQEEKP